MKVCRRPFGPDGIPLSLFGMGGIRLPVKGRDKNVVDHAAGFKLVDRALELGVNYFDTGYVYHNGAGERFYGEALSRHPRGSFMLGDKMCTWKIKGLGEAKAMFEEQLKRCRVEYFDFYMLHSLGNAAQYRKVYREEGVLKYLQEEKKRGRIRYLGFSFHGSAELLKEVLGDAKWDMGMILMNPIVYEGRNKAKELYGILEAAGVPVWVMEPLAGGRCATLNSKAMEMLKAYRPEASAASWAFRFAASHPKVACVLSGISKIEHLEENVRTLGEGWKPLSAEERETYRKAVAEFLKCHGVIGCTGCGYCEPCPYGVAIPEIFSWWNSFAAEGKLPKDEDARAGGAFLRSYFGAIPERRGAERCIGCGKCLKACPQWIFRIPTEMEKIDAFVEKIRRKVGGGRRS